MNVKEKYTKPQIEINEFKVTEIMTASDDNDRPWGKQSIDVDLFE